MTERRFVAYYRVSTQQQGRSGLGLEAQQQAVWDYVKGRPWHLVAEFTEVESGNRDNRPQLAAALAACRLHRATLVVAKLDRLSRNAAFLLALRNSDADFIAVDMPDANRLTVGVLALVAEHEREAISLRTKAALAAAKARGVQLGNPANLDLRARRLGAAASAKLRQSRAAQLASDLAPTIEGFRRNGASTLRGLADELNRCGIPAPRGGRWTAAQVRRVSRIKNAVGP